MAKRIPTTYLLFFLVCLMVTPSGKGARAQPPELARTLDKDEVTLLVTDSGLGGLAVCAGIDQKARQQRHFGRVRLIFCNALPEANQGYNKMRSPKQKARVFSSALSGMVRSYKPDAILIACNTLSVVYPETEFSRSATIPVVGIVDLGADMLLDGLLAHRKSAAVIFGTETTIGAKAHERALISRGIARARLVSQACPDLAGEIESDAGSERVRTAIDLFADEAAQRIPADADTVLAGLCCTHYGYCAAEFATTLRAHSGRVVIIVDPTQRMSELVFSANRHPVMKEPLITVEVASRAVITPDEIRTISGLVEPVSPATADALRHYRLQRDLFTYHPE